MCRGPRILLVLLSVATIATLVYLATLPSQAECRATGRIVDPTERHCESGDGFQQLQGHAAFHATEAGLGVLILLAGGFAIRVVIARSRDRRRAR